MDISGEHAEVQAIANTAWTDAVKAKWTKYQEDNKDK
jgi:stage V sporulation protein SpoVS